MSENKILAKVEEKVITESNLENFIKTLPEQQKAGFSTEEGKKRLLDELVNQELVYLEAVDTKLNEEEDFNKELEKLAANLLKQYYLDKLLLSTVISDEEAKEYYENNTMFFETGNQIKASHILVPEKEKAEELLKEIKAGADFAEVAKENSTCPSSEKGGDLGFFAAGQMVPEFEKAAFDLKEGEISDVVETNFGCHIIMTTEIKKSEVMPFEELKDTLKKQLLFGKQNKVYQEKMDSLKEKFNVEINEK